MKTTYFPHTQRRGTLPGVFNAEMFQEVLDDKKEVQGSKTLSERFKAVRAAVAAGDVEKANEKKKDLPCWLPQGESQDGSHAGKSCVSNGAYMVDLDHLTPQQMEDCIAKVRARAEELDIYFCHTTPRGEGLRIVARAHQRHNVPDTTWAQGQWLLGALDIHHPADPVCSDLCRCSYLVPRSEWHVLRVEEFFAAKPLVMLSGTKDGSAGALAKMRKTLSKAASGQQAAGNGLLLQACGVSVRPQPVEAEEGHPLTAWLDFSQCELPSSEPVHEGVPFSLLLRTAVEWNGVPGSGQRHPMFQKAFTCLRWVCENRVEWMLYYVQDTYGLTVKELLDLAQNLCEKPLPGGEPKFLKEVTQRARMLMDAGGDDGGGGDDDGCGAAVAVRAPMPKVTCLPPIFREYVKHRPAPGFEEATVMALLPVLGTVGTRLRATMPNGEEQSLSFITMIRAPQASGKSFATRMQEHLLADIRRRDEVADEQLRAWEEECRRAGKNKEEEPRRPDVMKRLMPARTTRAKLLVHARNAKGLHLFIHAPEVDSMRSEKNSAWMQSDMVRAAFSNEACGQECISSETFSGTVPLYVNLLLCGTRGCCDAYIGKDGTENGLATRICFASLPCEIGAQMPRVARFNEKEEAEMQHALQQLELCTSLPRSREKDLGRIFDEWGREQCERAVKMQDVAFDTLRKRSGVIAFRAGMLAAALWAGGGYTKKRLRAFFRYVADAVLWGQMETCGDGLREAAAAAAIPRQQPDAYQNVGKEFTMADLQNVLSAQGSATPAKNVVTRWKKDGYVETIAPGQYQKTNKTA